MTNAEWLYEHRMAKMQSKCKEERKKRVNKCEGNEKHTCAVVAFANMDIGHTCRIYLFIFPRDPIHMHIHKYFSLAVLSLIYLLNMPVVGTLEGNCNEGIHSYRRLLSMLIFEYSFVHITTTNLRSTNPYIALTGTVNFSPSISFTNALTGIQKTQFFFHHYLPIEPPPPLTSTIIRRVSHTAFVRLLLLHLLVQMSQWECQSARLFSKFPTPRMKCTAHEMITQFSFCLELLPLCRSFIYLLNNDIAVLHARTLVRIRFFMFSFYFFFLLMFLVDEMFPRLQLSSFMKMCCVLFFLCSMKMMSLVGIATNGDFSAYYQAINTSGAINRRLKWLFSIV